MLEFKNVSKEYRGNVILSNLSLKIGKGELVVLIGLSGCGKTTTLKMINRLIEPSSGTIFIDGEDICKEDPIKLRRNMGYVIQQTGLFPHMTVKENIELIPTVMHADKAQVNKRTKELMEMVGLNEEYLDRYPLELSGGQQQRIGVARAFALDPEIILMDEPFSALDPITRLGLQDELLKIQQRLKKTIVFVTHDINEALKIADRICIMGDKNILQYDTPENILKNPASPFISEFIGRNRIWNMPQYIRAKDIMVENPVSCTSDTSVEECLRLANSYNIDNLPILDSGTKKLLGMVMVKDKQLLSHEDRHKAIGEFIEIMNDLNISPEATLIDIVNLIDRYNITSIPVMDHDGTLRGLITKSNLLTTLSQQYLRKEEVM